MSKPKFKEIVLLGLPVVLLALLGSLLQGRSFHFLQKKIDSPVRLVIEEVTLAPITTARAIDEIYTPLGQTPVPGTVSGPPQAFAEFKGIDHKAIVVLNYQGNKPSWWGQDEAQTSAGNGFVTSTASTLAWNVNNDLAYQTNGKMRVYMTPKRTAGIFVRGNPRYDATLDRYVAMFYFPLSRVPAKQGSVKFAASFWPNQVSPAAKFSIWLNKKDKGRRSIKNPT